MFRILRPVMVMTIASITGGLLAAPGAAYAADTTTKLSAASMAAELKAVSTTSTAAAKSGWQATTIFTSPELAFTDQYRVDPAGGVASSIFRFGGEFGATYAVASKGMYEYSDNLTTLAAVKMMGRPSVRYVFTSRAVSLDAYITQNILSPAALLTENVAHAGTKTAHDDGSRHYAFKDRDGMPRALHVNPAGMLASARAGSPA